jgi:hypothetical protein
MPESSSPADRVVALAVWIAIGVASGVTTINSG